MTTVPPTKRSTVQCSICAELRYPVELCHTCNNQEDKRICESCAVALHAGCRNVACNCFGFKCAYCRVTDKTHRKWTDTSILYWEARAKEFQYRLDLCAVELDNLTGGVGSLSFAE
jgi:hypothetical protein